MIVFPSTVFLLRNRRGAHSINTEDTTTIEPSKSKTVCTTDLVFWSFQVARGMDYLASKNVLHGDLAARNVLLCDKNVVKICDFGLSKNLYKSEIYEKKSNTKLPYKWLALESIQFGTFSVYSDIWSFGSLSQVDFQRKTRKIYKFRFQVFSCGSCSRLEQFRILAWIRIKL